MQQTSATRGRQHGWQHWPNSIVLRLQADVYSFGVTLWELLERKRPYKGMDPYQIQARVISGCSRLPDALLRRTVREPSAPRRLLCAS